MAELNPHDYHHAMVKLRDYFVKEGFIEVPTQCRMTCLSACEDPKTVASYLWNGAGNGIARGKGHHWPLKQTGQMDMELDYLKAVYQDAKSAPVGFFCETISYRDEPNPKEGRHSPGPFPLPEWEEGGGFDALLKRETGLLLHLGYTFPEGMDHFPIIEYDQACIDFGVKELDDDHEEMLCRKHGPVVFLVRFPVHTSPFFNMKLDEKKTHAMKCDVLLNGMETIGSAERSTDKDEMRYMFDTISNGEYKAKLYDAFGEERIEKELAEYFHLPFVPRCGGGIGLTRLIRSMKLENLL